MGVRKDADAHEGPGCPLLITEEQALERWPVGTTWRGKNGHPLVRTIISIEAGRVTYRLGRRGVAPWFVGLETWASWVGEQVEVLAA